MHDLDLGEFHGVDPSVNPDVCMLLSNLVKIQLKKVTFNEWEKSKEAENCNYGKTNPDHEPIWPLRPTSTSRGPGGPREKAASFRFPGKSPSQQQRAGQQDSIHGHGPSLPHLQECPGSHRSQPELASSQGAARVGEPSPLGPRVDTRQRDGALWEGKEKLVPGEKARAASGCPSAGMMQATHSLEHRDNHGPAPFRELPCELTH